MPLDKKTGPNVSKDGRKFEEIVRDDCIEAGHVLTQIQYKPDGVKNLYGAQLAIDVHIFPNDRFLEGLSIECTRQNVSGSGDHKIPHKMMTLIKCCPFPSVLIMDGKGYEGNHGALKWAKAQIGKNWLNGEDYSKLRAVFTYREFIEWIGLGDDYLLQRRIR